MSLRPFVIDCDTGRDDALTLWLAARMNLPLAAVIASYGNTCLSNVLENTRRVLALAGADEIPLLTGLERPETIHKLFAPLVEARQQAGGNGVCNIRLPKTSWKNAPKGFPTELATALRHLASQLGPLDYFIIGPASNAAKAARSLGKDLKDVIAQVTMLGGKLGSMWSEMPGPDFNVGSDPYAVRDLLNLGIPVRFLPINATWPISMELQDIEQLKATTPLSEKAKELMIAYCTGFAPEPIFRFHDPSILFAAQMPEHFKPERLRIVCDEADEDFGRLVSDPDGALCEVYHMNSTLQGFFKTSILRGLGFKY
jgi:inosine-uridine nucleoside N-ribohydrolase